jgi:hypothetical protein
VDAFGAELVSFEFDGVEYFVNKFREIDRAVKVWANCSMALANIGGFHVATSWAKYLGIIAASWPRCQCPIQPHMLKGYAGEVSVSSHEAFNGTPVAERRWEIFVDVMMPFIVHGMGVETVPRRRGFERARQRIRGATVDQRDA